MGDKERNKGDIHRHREANKEEVWSGWPFEDLCAMAEHDRQFLTELSDQVHKG